VRKISASVTTFCGGTACTAVATHLPAFVVTFLARRNQLGPKARSYSKGSGGSACAKQCLHTSRSRSQAALRAGSGPGSFWKPGTSASQVTHALRVSSQALSIVPQPHLLKSLHTGLIKSPEKRGTLGASDPFGNSILCAPLSCVHACVDIGARLLLWR
jgi:hypothetical protein